MVQDLGGPILTELFLHWDALKFRTNLDLLTIILSRQKESPNKNGVKGEVSQEVKNAILLTKLFKPLNLGLLS